MKGIPLMCAGLLIAVAALSCCPALANSNNFRPDLSFFGCNAPNKSGPTVTATELATVSTSDQKPFTVIPNGDDGRALFVLSRNRQQLEIHDCRVNGTDCSIHRPSLPGYNIWVNGPTSVAVWRSHFYFTAVLEIIATYDVTEAVIRCSSRDLTSCTAFDTRDTLYTRPEILVATPNALLIANRRLYIAITASKFDTNNKQYFYMNLWSCDPNMGPTSTGCVNVSLPTFTPPNTSMVALAADSSAVYVNLPWTRGGNRPVVIRCGFGAQACSIVELRTELEDNAPFEYSPATAASFAGRALFLMHYTDGSDPLTWREGVYVWVCAPTLECRRKDLEREVLRLTGRYVEEPLQLLTTSTGVLIWTHGDRLLLTECRLDKRSTNNWFGPGTCVRYDVATLANIAPDVYNGDRSKYYDRDYFIGNSAVYTSRGQSTLVAPFLLYSVPNASTGKAYAINVGLPCKDAPYGCKSYGCAALGYNCGTLLDGCHRAIDCGGCAQSTETCGGSGVHNICGSLTRRLS